MTRPTHTIRRLASTALATITIGGCAATSDQPATTTSDQMCVVSIEPQMKMVTFAAPPGLDGGVTSLFFSALPDVHPGDLVRVDNSAGHGGPKIDRVAAAADACADVAQTAADAHKHH